MKDYIAGLVAEIHDDFQAYLAKGEDLCHLRRLNFSLEAAPDYSPLPMQQLYLLRYFSAYLAEYYLTWKHLLELGHLPREMKVLSIGCGNGVDCTALRFALGENPAGHNLLAYDGVDKVKWSYRDEIALTQGARLRYRHEDVGRWTKFATFDYNTIYFPKSLGELSEQAFRNMLQAVANSEIASESLSLICNMTGLNSQKEELRLAELALTLSQTHELMPLACSKPFTLPEQSTVKVTGYFYPAEVIQLLQQLSSFCPGYRICPDGGRCSLGRYPMLTTRNMQFWAVHLVR